MCNHIEFVLTTPKSGAPGKNFLAYAKTLRSRVSVEMFEHMRNYQLLLSRIASWMNTTGKLFVGRLQSMLAPQEPRVRCSYYSSLSPVREITARRVGRF